MNTETDILTEKHSGDSLQRAGSANPSKWKDTAVFRSDHVEWGTPPDLKESLDKEFAFDLDPCTPGQTWDGTAISWAGRRVFCNPPYGRGMEKWLANDKLSDRAAENQKP